MSPRSRFHELLKIKVKDELDRRAGAVIDGTCTDYPAYRESVGYIQGLEAALKLADDTDADMNEG